MRAETEDLPGSVSGGLCFSLVHAPYCEMKPLRCLLHLHIWHTYHNDEGDDSGCRRGW
jgi:hypothetical protein